MTEWFFETKMKEDKSLFYNEGTEAPAEDGIAYKYLIT